MRFPRRKHAERRLMLELTPMIDVVFLLIIFFMTTAQFARLTRADVDLPREKGEQRHTPEEEGIVINITRDGRVIVSNETVTLDRLEELVFDEIERSRGRSAELAKVMIRPDRNGSTDRLNDVITRLQGMGVGGARLATEVPGQTGR
ncbi:MAG: biopolymer transporter ExbD [Phycisphaerales bacterium]|nr:MAG: biopolymer transporter ExbD [Phycisphaerales bacterium]